MKNEKIQKVLENLQLFSTCDEYSIESFHELIEKKKEENIQWILSNNEGFDILKYTVYMQNGDSWDCGYVYLRVYGIEKEDLFQERIKKAKAADRKRKETLKKNEKEKEAAKAALLKDPEYIKFLELQEKFK